MIDTEVLTYDRIEILCDVLVTFVKDLTKGSMYSPMVAPAAAMFQRKIKELPESEKDAYLQAVYRFADLARAYDMTEADYRGALNDFLTELKTPRA